MDESVNSLEANEVEKLNKLNGSQFNINQLELKVLNQIEWM